MKMSTIFIELNPGIKTYYPILPWQDASVRYLYRVFVDEICIAEHALPFHPSDPFIELTAEPEFPFRGDGHEWIWSRLFGDYVLWFAPIESLAGEFSYAIPRRGVDESTFYVFKVKDYEQETMTVFRENLTKPFDSSTTLPAMTSEEVAEIVKRGLPDRELALYTTPEPKNDPMGDKIIRAIEEYVEIDALTDSIKPVHADTITELKIGLDNALEGYPECEWLIGRSDQGLAICFLSRPRFPVFITSQKIDNLLKQFI